jgi:hypothetical protein
MGAAQLCKAVESEPRFCSVAVESPFSNFREIGYDRVGQFFTQGLGSVEPFFDRSSTLPSSNAMEIQAGHGIYISGKWLPKPSRLYSDSRAR